MKQNKTKYIFPFLICVFMISACSDFLDTEQMGVISQNDFYQTDDEVTEALYGVYDKIQSENSPTFQFKVLLSDNALAGGGGRGDNSYGEELDDKPIETSW